MANSLPFNAVAVDGEYDRVYKAEDWAWYFAEMAGIEMIVIDENTTIKEFKKELRMNEVYYMLNKALC